jgi:hypothetical protein
VGGFAGGSIELTLGQGARPAFRIPRGYWYGESGEHVPPSAPVAGESFYLRRRNPGDRFAQTPKITRGFAGRGFFDEGLGVFARALPDEFNDMITEHLGSRIRLRFRFDVVGSSRL